MALDINALAEEINKAIGATDKDGQPIEITDEMKAYAQAVINTLQAGIVTHALVTGDTVAGAPLVNGAASDGIVLGLLPPLWQGVMTSAIPDADPAALLNDAANSTTYLTANTKITFSAGQITGTASSTPTAPGPLLLGAGNGGIVEGLSGEDWANAAAPPDADQDLTNKIYTAIVKYIENNAEVTYPPGTVQGVCPPASGPLAGGFATGGFIL
jgi:hypothetical protein